jgi:hypothetical protein
MVVATEERVMAKAKGRPKTSTRDDVTAKVDRGIVKKARFVAEHKGIPVAELLSDVLRAPIEREFDKAVRESKGREGQA